MIGENLLQTAKRLTASERREILARLVAEQSESEVGTIWKSVRFGENLRVVAHATEQEKFVDSLSETLRRGALARVENLSDGTFEIYGADRTFYVTMSEKREFVALLSSWSPNSPPREINLTENENAAR
jgi:hypothetical protein